MIIQNKLEPVKMKNSFQMIEHFLNSFILKRKVLITVLHLAKHNLEKGPKIRKMSLETIKNACSLKILALS